MYLWVGCKLPESFEQEIRSHCLERNRDIGLDTVAFSLPQHVSLKISFQSERYDEILEDLTAYLSEQAPLSLYIQGAQQADSILWMPVKENDRLRRLHDELDARLESRFGVPQHEFDKCFLFHSTLFMDPDTENISKMRDALAQYPIERELHIDTFLLGISESGRSGDCRIVREIKL